MTHGEVKACLRAIQTGDISFSRGKRCHRGLKPESPGQPVLPAGTFHGDGVGAISSPPQQQV